jgi:hypothetical protein
MSDLTAPIDLQKREDFSECLEYAKLLVRILNKSIV